ncbi:aminoglycoside phosphotransferase [Pseudonocardia nematodicida]|uniref:Aminoglycoside phosphotransferase n=1 Tax=Pseudonocardia nematodicida TaxID=1206997 RepID=A0ABV1KJG3_9PSEU
MGTEGGLTAPDVAAWPGLRVTGALAGGHRSAVWAAEVGHRRLVVHRSTRSSAALDWELDLLDELAGHGFRVPETVPTAAGARRDGRFVVRTWLDGDPPGPDDRDAVAAELRRLHAYTGERPQRPGFAGTAALVRGGTRGGDVDLAGMPPQAASACRAAWAALDGEPVSVVHGDPGRENVRMLEGRPGFLDWDECRVDRSVLDLDGWADVGDTVRRAVDAWEAAAGWRAEPAYARTRLAALCGSAVGETGSPVG